MTRPTRYLTEPEWFARNMPRPTFLEQLENQCPYWLIGMCIVAVLMLYLTS